MPRSAFLRLNDAMLDLILTDSRDSKVCRVRKRERRRDREDVWRTTCSQAPEHKLSLTPLRAAGYDTEVLTVPLNDIPLGVKCSLLPFLAWSHGVQYPGGLRGRCFSGGQLGPMRSEDAAGALFPPLQGPHSLPFRWEHTLPHVYGMFPIPSGRRTTFTRSCRCRLVSDAIERERVKRPRGSTLSPSTHPNHTSWQK